MPTLNEAAEALRLRAALKGIRTVLSGAAPIDRGIALLHRDREEIEQHLAALAADPGPLVAAVEQIAKAVEATICGSCGNRIGWQGEFDAAQKRLGRDDWRTCSGCQSTRAALAAYHAALGGTDGPR